jgi:hypothetical protein
VQVDELPAGHDVRAGALAYYGSKRDGWFPTDVQAYLAVVAGDPKSVARELTNAFRSEGAMLFLGRPRVTRRGDAVLVTLGRTGAARAKEALAATEPPPLFHLVVDVAHFAAPEPDDPNTIVHVGSGLAGEAGLGEALSRLVSTVDLAIGPDLRVIATLAPPAAVAASTEPNPRRAAISACDRLIERAWESVARSFTRLGITDLRPLEESYRRGTGTATYSFSCVGDLSADERACLLAASDPLAALDDCGAGALKLPSIDDPFEPTNPVDALLGRGPKPTMAQLAGTWHSVEGSSRWVIDASGKAAHHYEHRAPEGVRFEIVADGNLRERSPNGTWSHTGFVLDGDDLYLGSSRAYPLPGQDHFIAGFSQGFDDAWVVRDAAGCFVVDESGRNQVADCQFTDVGGAPSLVATFRGGRVELRVLAGHLVDPSLVDQHYRRR